jgi:hypothetical protein
VAASAGHPARAALTAKRGSGGRSHVLPAKATSFGRKETASVTDDVYVPPWVWTWQPASGGPFAGIHRPTAGGRFERALRVGRHLLQLHSLATPNGVKAP